MTDDLMHMIAELERTARLHIALKRWLTTVTTADLERWFAL